MKSTVTLLSLFLLIIIIYVDFVTSFSLFRFQDSPRDYFLGDPLKVKVDKLTASSAKLPYEYYSVPFCRPDDTTDYFSDFLGNQLNSLYTLKMHEPLTCKVACRLTLDAQSAKSFQEKIRDYYQVNMILDGLPVAVQYQRFTGSNIYQIGYSIGLMGQYAGSEYIRYYIYNHLVFTVKYHKDAQADSAKIVGFEVIPYSGKHNCEGNWNEIISLTTRNVSEEEIYFPSGPQEVLDKEEIVFTYDVIFQESNITWGSRWNTYLRPQAEDMKFYAAVNYVITLLFFLGLVAVIMTRTYRDISKYNDSELLEETGWKLVHGDVFRRPFYSDLLCVFTGTGVQCFGTIVTALLVFLVSGFILPSDWDKFWGVILILWALMGCFAGYSSARLYRMFEGLHWRNIAAKTAFMLPAPSAIIFFIFNSLTYYQKSASGLPSAAMFALILLWFGISVPLVFIGSYFGFRTHSIKDPVRTNKISREIPKQPCHKRPIISILLGGILPFGCIFYELLELLASIWHRQFYYVQSLQFIALLTLLATCAGTTIVLCYFQLCREDYRWWWTSYLTSGISGVYLFLYAAYFFLDRLEITKPILVFLYFGYMLIGSFAFFVFTGTIGFYACFCFTRLIYSSLKMD